MGRIRLARFGVRDIGGSLHPARGPRLRKDDSIIYRGDKRLGGESFSFLGHSLRLPLMRHQAVWRALQLFPLSIKLSSTLLCIEVSQFCIEDDDDLSHESSDGDDAPLSIGDKALICLA